MASAAVASVPPKVLRYGSGVFSFILFAKVSALKLAFLKAEALLNTLSEVSPVVCSMFQ